MVPPEHAVVLSAVLLGIGVAGVVARRNLLVSFMSVELMLNAAGLAFVAFARRHLAAPPEAAARDVLGAVAEGHGAAFLGAAVAAAEAAVGLAIVLLLYRTRADLDADKADLLRG